MQALVQLRGEIDMSQGVEDTMSMLNLGRVNHCTLVPETDTYRGMVTKVNDWVAHGQPSADTVELVIATRGETLDGDEIDEEWVAENTEYDSIEALAAALVDEETTLQEQGISPTLRLHPPRGGHNGLKHPTKEGGQLGKHTTEEIDSLLTTMR
ncbi:50S ribosomal protein L30 [Halocatena pleomorpha]|uniref:Large ribosomal subunit protein uL30 n=1 Tax=Halocatena pleomorpha TaxID=1785090 RepID=A0A3P3RBG3_9EURY|nr:50S ribosomal protein L30 [Halocatena pleomorpha]RRJ30309.1 50S ribosomal protein L30 [Halocatena pleomorpha]